MKRIVIDTSVIIKFFFPESGADRALQLKKEHIEKKITMCSRDLLLYEFASAFRHYKPVQIEDKDFALAAQTLASLKVQIVSLDYKDLSDLFLLSKKLTLSVYDCSYILLSQKLRAPLFTADKKLYQSCKNIVSSTFI